MAESLATVLVVDDDTLQRDVVRDALEAHFRVLERDSAVNLCASLHEVPDIVLLDIGMPQVDGFTACLALRSDPRFAGTPVLFLSGHVKLEDRLAAYDAGGEDFIPKPFRSAELRVKVTATLQRLEARRQAEQTARDAMAAAMVAMTSASELGVVIQALRHCGDARDLSAIATLTLEAMAEFGLEACLWLNMPRGDQLFRSSWGQVTPIEEGVLRQLALGDTLQYLGRQMACHYGALTLLVKNLPHEDPERTGRLRDHIALLSEAVASRLRSLGDHLQLQRQRDALTKIATDAIAALEAVNECSLSQHGEVKAELNAMLERVEDILLHTGLTEEQEEKLSSTLRDTANHIQDVGDRGIGVLEYVTHLRRHLAGQGLTGGKG